MSENGQSSITTAWSSGCLSSVECRFGLVEDRLPTVIEARVDQTRQVAADLSVSVEESVQPGAIVVCRPCSRATSSAIAWKLSPASNEITAEPISMCLALPDCIGKRTHWHANSSTANPARGVALSFFFSTSSFLCRHSSHLLHRRREIGGHVERESQGRCRRGVYTAVLVAILLSGSHPDSSVR